MQYELNINKVRQGTGIEILDNVEQNQPQQKKIQCKCGSDLFFESRRVAGWWKMLIDGDGLEEDTDLSGLRFGQIPKTVKCAECGRSNKNPRYI